MSLHIGGQTPGTLEEGQLLIDNVVGQSLAQFNREEYYNYPNIKSELISPKSSKVIN